MKRSLTVSLYVYLVYVPLANGNIDDIVKDAVQSVFLDGKDPGIARFSSAYFRGMGPAPDFKQIPAGTFVNLSVIFEFI